jgi:hypothetical protein
MFHYQVVFPMKQGTTRPQLDEIMPDGWLLQETDDGDRFNIIYEFDAAKVGHLFVLPEKVVFSVDEHNSSGKKFWQNFSMKYTELDPFDLLYGVLYVDGGNGHVYDLDELPKHLPMVPPKEILAHYDKIKTYYVEFALGDWHPIDNQIKVKSAQRILAGGELGIGFKDHVFRLGVIENEATM